MSAIIISVMALIFSSSSRRCGNVCKRSRGGVVGNGVCGLWESWQLFHRAVNICFPSAERPFSTFPIAENSMIAYLYIAFPQERIYNELWLVNANYNSDSWRKLWEY